MPPMSVTRSSSVAPRDSPTAISQRGAPVRCSEEQLAARLGDDHVLVDHHHARRGAQGQRRRLALHGPFLLPVGVQPTMRLSIERTTTTPCPTTGDDSTSLDSLGLPQQPCRPCRRPARRRRRRRRRSALPSVPTPAVSGAGLDAPQLAPVAASTRAMAAVGAGDDTVLPISAGENW
jgi:hypothetical protein